MAAARDEQAVTNEEEQVALECAAEIEVAVALGGQAVTNEEKQVALETV